MVDDLLDFTADEAALGKRAGKDAERGKADLPRTARSRGGSKPRPEELVESAKQQIAVFGSAGWRLTWLANYVLERSH